MRLRIAGIGAWGPGFSDWPSLSEWLRGGNEPAERVTARPAPECIPPRERRRAPLSVKLAVAVAEQACAMAQVTPEDAVCVFASGMGDMDITDYMCRTLASDQPLVSPTKFHNSVHNAPVGYWSISQGAKRSSNAVAGFLDTVPISLLEAATQCVTEQVPVLWASQDIASPEPFRMIADIPEACAFALLLLPESDDADSSAKIAGTSISLALSESTPAWPVLQADTLKSFYENNPTARLLPLLEAMAGARDRALSLPLSDSMSLVLTIGDAEISEKTVAPGPATKPNHAIEPGSA